MIGRKYPGLFYGVHLEEGLNRATWITSSVLDVVKLQLNRQARPG